MLQPYVKPPTVTIRLPIPGLYPNLASVRIVMTRLPTPGRYRNLASVRTVMTRSLTLGLCLNRANARRVTTRSLMAILWRYEQIFQHHTELIPATA